MLIISSFVAKILFAAPYQTTKEAETEYQNHIPTTPEGRLGKTQGCSSFCMVSTLTFVLDDEDKINGIKFCTTLLISLVIIQDILQHNKEWTSHGILFNWQITCGG